MINAKDLGERLSRMFDFIYEVKDDYYVIGRYNFRKCYYCEIDVYKGFKKALEEKDNNWHIEQYKRIRSYTSDCKSWSRDRDKDIVEFVQELSDMDLELLSRQVDDAMECAKIAYNRNHF